MRRTYNELTLEERVEIQWRREQDESIRMIAEALNRAPSTISRECRRVRSDGGYSARTAHGHAHHHRPKRRVERKLANPELWQLVRELLHKRWSPQQIAGILAEVSPAEASLRVSHETLYTAIYLTPRGALRKELISCLRQNRSSRKPRTRGKDRRGQIPNRQSIHVRPPEVEDRQIPGHWEGDLIKGAGNRSSVATLVERTSGFVVLAKMGSATAADALSSFSQALEGIPEVLRKTLTYDQGREMTYHDALTLRTGVQVYFADPHSPWQRGSNENTNGLLRQYLPKGADLSQFSQSDLNDIALSLNTRPRARHHWRTPLQVFTTICSLPKPNWVRCIKSVARGP